MNEQMINNEDIDLNRLFAALRREKWTVAAASVLCALVAVVAALLFAIPRYQSAVLFYAGSDTMVENFIVILDTRQTLLEVAEETGTDRTVAALRRMIKAENVDAAQFFRVTVTSPDPQEAKALAASVSRVLPRRAAGIVGEVEVKIADAPVAAEEPSSPDYCVTALAGLLIGLTLSSWAILRKELREDRK